ncbi:MAG: group 1 truncated hemoglobin [Rhodoglobus sp.]|nr:group 1 truncated hemoglobin [Rhodoglobus sp.]
MTLYDELGGDAGVSAIVDALVDSIHADPEFASWFAGADLDRLKSHQRAFLAVALDGPESYAGRSLRSAHSGMAITPTAFASFIGHLGQAVRGIGARDDLAADLVGRVSQLRAAVVEER